MQSKSLQVLKFFNFSEVESLPTVRVIASAFRSRGLLQECHPSFLNFRTNELQVSIKNLFWTRLCSWGCFWYNLAGDNNSLENDRKTILLKMTLQSILSSTKSTCMWWRRFEKNWQILFMPMSKTCFKVEKYRWVAFLSLVSFCHLQALSSADKYPISNINHFIRHYTASYTTPLFFSFAGRTKISSVGDITAMSTK